MRVCAGARVRTPDQPVRRGGAGAAAGQLSAARCLARRGGQQPRVPAGHHPHHPGLAPAAPPLIQYLQVSSYRSAVENIDFSYWRGVKIKMDQYPQAILRKGDLIKKYFLKSKVSRSLSNMSIKAKLLVSRFQNCITLGYCKYFL